MLERWYGFRTGAWSGKALFQKGSGWKTLHDRNANSAQKRLSYCVVYENQNKKFFPLLLERKNTWKQGWIACFFTLKISCTYSNNGKNVKITETVAIAVTKHPAKLVKSELKNCREEKLWQFLYYLVLDSISAFRLCLKTHMHSAVLSRSLNNSIWFRFDWNVQYYFVSIRKAFIDIFIALTEFRQKLLHTLYHKKTRKILFSHEKATQNFLCTKKTTQNLFARGLSIRQLPALGCWNVTLLLLLLLQKKCEYHRTCDCLVATACQDFSAWNERKKLQHFHQLVLNMFWDLWKSYARTFRCLALLRW